MVKWELKIRERKTDSVVFCELYCIPVDSENIARHFPKEKYEVSVTAIAVN